MSSDQAADDAQDPGQVSFILMRAEDTFDDQERVMSPAAYDLQCRATSHSAFCGHPGFVPDEYLDGLSTDTTITAAELRLVGMWERVDGGYRVLDWEAVEICLDRVRETRGDDAQALTGEHEREALVRAQMAKAMVVTPPCAVCRNPSARVELVAPGQPAAEWEQWPRTVQASILRRRQPGQWYLLFKGVATCNGYGDPIDASRRMTSITTSLVLGKSAPRADRIYFRDGTPSYEGHQGPRLEGRRAGHGLQAHRIRPAPLAHGQRPAPGRARPRRSPCSSTANSSNDPRTRPPRRPSRRTPKRS